MPNGIPPIMSISQAAGRKGVLDIIFPHDKGHVVFTLIAFRRKTTVKTLCIYADYKSDESYTPSKISVRVGNNFHNLQEIRQLELVEPSGWIHVPLTDNHKKPTRTFMIQIAVLANHQNGRDTHMRQIKIYTPVEESSIGKFPRCTTIDFMMYRSIR
nr:PREDICTED: anaphase-promoting complex subunit 10-like [Equus przewalskii]